MPNITKYMGRAIPGMSVIRGAWDAGQGVSSLVEALQRRAAKQSGGPVPMKDIEKYLGRSKDDLIFTGGTIHKPWGARREHELSIPPRYLGAVEKAEREEITSFTDQMEWLDKDIEEMVDAIEAMKSVAKIIKESGGRKKMKEENARWLEADSPQVQDTLERYLQPYSQDIRRVWGPKRPRYKARDSIWMSVLDAMKKREKKK